MITEERLNEIMSEVGAEYGYDSATAYLIPMTEVKANWRRTSEWVQMDLPDYLVHAPEDAVRSIIVTAFRHTQGEHPKGYGDAADKWLCSDDFVRLNQSTYLARRGADTVSDAEKLHAALERIKAYTAVPPMTVVAWDHPVNAKPIGMSSLLMRAVLLNPNHLKDVPDYVLDYILIERVVPLTCPYFCRPFTIERRTEKALATYPDRERAAEWLEDRGLPR